MTTFFNKLPNRILATFLIQDLDFEAQLLALKNVLGQNHQADEAYSQAVKNLQIEIESASGEYADHLDDEWVDHMHGSIFWMLRTVCPRLVC